MQFQDNNRATKTGGATIFNLPNPLIHLPQQAYPNNLEIWPWDQRWSIYGLINPELQHFMHDEDVMHYAPPTILE